MRLFGPHGGEDIVLLPELADKDIDEGFGCGGLQRVRPRLRWTVVRTSKIGGGKIIAYETVSSVTEW